MISKLLKKNKKGFTLMEMLIVVAIIAVLVAIAIPTFNASLNKARIATDEANIRAGYASTLATVLTSDFDVEQATGEKAYYYLLADGNVSKVDSADATAPTGAYECKATNKTAATVGGVTVGDAGTWAKGNKVLYTYSYDNNKIEIDVK